jgi:hypothetical protein
MPAEAGENQCEVVLVGCGAPNRGMGWYHAEQMLKGKCPSAKLCYIVEPWFLGAGACVATSVCARCVVGVVLGKCSLCWKCYECILSFGGTDWSLHVST